MFYLSLGFTARDGLNGAVVNKLDDSGVSFLNHFVLMDTGVSFLNHFVLMDYVREIDEATTPDQRAAIRHKFYEAADQLTEDKIIEEDFGYLLDPDNY